VRIVNAAAAAAGGGQKLAGRRPANVSIFECTVVIFIHSCASVVSIFVLVSAFHGSADAAASPILPGVGVVLSSHSGIVMRSTGSTTLRGYFILGSDFQGERNSRHMTCVWSNKTVYFPLYNVAVWRRQGRPTNPRRSCKTYITINPSPCSGNVYRRLNRHVNVPVGFSWPVSAASKR